MNRSDSESGTPPNAPAAAVSARRPARALLLLGTVAAAASALLLAQAATRPEAAPVVAQGTTTLNVADAAAAAATSSSTIEIKNYAFAPKSATVATGVKVTWVNEDSVPHTVTGKSGPASFDSGQINPGASYSAIFMTAGTYTYYCIDHPQMVATITVTGSSAAVAAHRVRRRAALRLASEEAVAAVTRARARACRCPRLREVPEASSVRSAAA